MVDPKLIAAELRAGELLSSLQSAVDGAPHWRIQARRLLWEINLLVIPEPKLDWLREVDDRKRRAEIAADLACEEVYG